MIKRLYVIVPIAVVGLAAGAFLILGDREAGQVPASAKATEESRAEVQFERGPHGGRLLRDGDRAIELTIFEENVEPQFRIYAYKDDKALVPATFSLAVALNRLGGRRDRFSFVPETDYLESAQIVEEPHSFDVEVEATIDGKPSRWTYASYEGRTTISAEAAKAAGLKTETAGPAKVQETETLTGRIVLNANRRADVEARFAGVVRDVRRMLGETVKKGDVLALVEGNDSLQVYPVVAPIDGVILSRNTNVGDVAGEHALFVIADLSEVWAEFHVFPKDLNRIKQGQQLRISSIESELKADAIIAWLLPTANLASQTVVARAPLPNPNGLWRPGMAVQGIVTVAEHDVPIAVKVAGLQRVRNFKVVFVNSGDTYEAQPLKLGAQDSVWAEVRDGLDAGERYVAENSFLVRADIEKSGASHDH